MDRFESHLDEVTKELKKRQERALEVASVFVLGEISLRAPVATGNLKGSYGRKIDMVALIAYMGTNVDYAPYVEYGTGVYAEDGQGRKTPWAFKGDDGEWHFTVGIRPQPHLRPAIADNRDRIRKMMEREMSR